MVVQLQINWTCRFKGHRHATEEEAQECIRRTGWLEQFDERQRAEIAFSRMYAAQFNHGTDGHNAKMIIAKLADMLDQVHPEGPHGRA